MRAFRRAAHSLRDLSRAQLEELAAKNRLKELPYVGDVTASIIAEVLAGKVPEYLTKVAVERPLPDLDANVASLLASLRGATAIRTPTGRMGRRQSRRWRARRSRWGASTSC